MDATVNQTRKHIEENAAAQLKAYEAELDRLHDRMGTFQGRRDYHQKMDVQQQIESLEEKCACIESEIELREYDKETALFLQLATEKQDIVTKKIHRKETFLAQKQKDGRQTRKRTTARNIKVQNNTGTTMTAANGASQSVLMDEFNARYNNKIPTIYMVVGDSCNYCESGKMCKMNATMVCETCGNATSFIDSSSGSLTYDDEVEYSNFSYRRIAHFTEWLSNFQARENANIPDQVLEDIMFKLKERKSNVSSITPMLIRSILKELKLNKYYDNTVLISCLLSGRSPPRLTPQQEDRLKRMFLLIQDSFEKHCPVERKNFLSYSYVIYKFCQLLGLNDYLQYFSLLKCKEKLAKMDAIFKNICMDLQWEFIPSL
jgi:hypothetical protein